MLITFAENESKIKKGVPIVEWSERKDTRVREFADGTVVLSMGIGKKRPDITRRNLQIYLRKTIQAAKGARMEQIALSEETFDLPHLKLSDRERGEMVAVNFELANYEYNELRTKPKDGWPAVSTAVIFGKTSKEFREGAAEGLLIGSEMNRTRTLANTPGGDMTPSALAQAARHAAKGLPIKVTVLGKKEMERIGMGAVLGVARGSSEEPKFIALEYMGAGKKTRPIVLVGKGVTFDTGGLNLKPSDGIYEMHMDMTGGAIAIHAAVLSAKLKLKKNVVALVPAVENMPSGSSYHPGDVLSSLSGKKIEVLNTDAEGRVILADGLTYAKRYNPTLVIDIATLTGAALVALGQHASAIMSPSTKLVERLGAWGEESGDYVWPFPLWSEYEEYVKGNFGDVANIPASGNSRYGGVINGGMFLYQFAKEYAKDTEWVHIDMASRMTPAPQDALARGATGEPLRLLIKVIREYAS